MARPRQFDECQALDGALQAFWQRGFAGTSISHLVEATGMQRQSLYNTFGDKHALFARVLQRYGEHAAELGVPLRAYLAGEGEALEALRAHAQASLGYQRKHGCGACMIVKTALEQPIDDPAIARVVRDAVKRTRGLLADVLARGQAVGEVRDDRAPGALANYLFAMLNGISALAQTGATKRDVDEALELGLAGLVPPTMPGKRSAARA